MQSLTFYFTLFYLFCFLLCSQTCDTVWRRAARRADEPLQRLLSLCLSSSPIVTVKGALHSSGGDIQTQWRSLSSCEWVQGHTAGRLTEPWTDFLSGGFKPHCKVCGQSYPLDLEYFEFTHRSAKHSSPEEQQVKVTTLISKTSFQCFLVFGLSLDFLQKQVLVFLGFSHVFDLHSLETSSLCL